MDADKDRYNGIERLSSEESRPGAAEEVTTEQRNRIEIDDVERSRFSAMYAYRYTDIRV